jgi:S-adenosylmethionine:tRNA ribosyltransferase-isomerase
MPDPLEPYDFDLPHEQIAQEPAPERSGSRLLVIDREKPEGAAWADHAFSELPGLLQPGDVLVVNDTRVFPARLVGRRETGGKGELFLVQPLGDGRWEALARPAKKLPVGATVAFGGEEPDLVAEVVEERPEGRRVVSFTSRFPIDEAIDRVGRVPLPPYIKRDGAPTPTDEARYQTVYARERGAVAAPTAGLHFTPELLAALAARGVEHHALTLHVGYGTFEPVRAADLAEHRVLPERASIPPATADAVRRARADGRRVIAVGTTTTRALESAAREDGAVPAGPLVADRTVVPGYRFRVVDGLITNFHLPRSSLLLLVGAFGGRERMMNAYRHAVAEGYRFYSYGDAMLIV